jgi:Rap1a immunity proteins
MKKLLFIALATSLNAQAITGNELYVMLTSEIGTTESFQGLGYIQGFADNAAWSKFLEEDKAKARNKKPNYFGLICAPENSTAGQYVDIVTNHLKNKPEERHLSAGTLTLAALIKAWPCPK